MEPIIERRQDTTPRYDKDYALAFGFPPLKPAYYVHKETMREYAYIAGGIAFGALGGKPGCAVVVAVTRDEIPSFEVLDGTFELSPRALMRACFALRMNYGYGDGSELFPFWIGEDRFPEILHILNQNDADLYLQSCEDADKVNWADIIIENIRYLSEERRLRIYHPDIRDQLQSFTVTEAEIKIDPALDALGGVLHYLLHSEPWIAAPDACNLEEEWSLADNLGL